MRRMITEKQQEIVNHFTMTGRGTLAVNVPLDIPRIELTGINNSGISSNYNIDFLAAMDEDEGDYTVELQLTDEGIIIDPDYNMTGGCYLKILNLPTTDPHVAGALWNDNGTLKISAGGN